MSWAQLQQFMKLCFQPFVWKETKARLSAPFVTSWRSAFSFFHAFLRRRANRESYGLFSFRGSPLTGQSCRTLFSNALIVRIVHNVESLQLLIVTIWETCYTLNICICYIDSSSQKIRFLFIHSPLSSAPEKEEREREGGKKGWLRCSASESGSYFTNKAMVCLAKEMLDFRLQAKTVVSQASTRKYTAAFSQEYNDQVKNTLFFPRI